MYLTILKLGVVERKSLTSSPYNENYVKSNHIGLNFSHTLRDIDQFTATSQHFKEFGVYTKHLENRFKTSKYMAFWKEERRRCLEGYHIGRDFITGYYYWYLNYMPIEKVVYTEEDHAAIREGKKVSGDRIVSFPSMWDYDYHFYHYIEEAEQSGEHGLVLKSRGKGYSYKGASMALRNYFLIRDSKTYIVAGDKTYLDGSDAIMTRAFNMREFVNEHTAFFKHSQKKNTTLHMRASKEVIYKGQKLEKGYKSSIIGLSVKDNADKVRGQRGKLMIFEEAGSNPQLVKAWQIARESFEQDSVVFGLMLGFGTSGDDMKSFRGLKEMFYKPGAYNIHGIPDIWSKRPTTKTAFFCPAYTNINGFTDRNGNTDIYNAYEIEEDKFDEMRLNRAEPASIIQRRMERPKHPEEALLRRAVSDFPIQKLRDRLAELQTNDTEREAKWVGRMTLTSEGKAEFIYDPNVIEISEYPHDKSMPSTGAIVIWEKPVKDREGKVPSFMYLAGTDPYDHDKSTTDSLGSTLIANKVTGVIVAEYTGRPSKSTEYYEQLRLLLMYFNAVTNYENNLLGFKNYIVGKRQSYLLLPAPEIVRKTSKSSTIDREFGTPGLTGIFTLGKELVNEYLQRKVFENEDIEYVHTIKSVALLQELIDYNDDDNFDRIIALFMLLIHLEERKDIVVRNNIREAYSIEEDSFFDKLLYGEID